MSVDGELCNLELTVCQLIFNMLMFLSSPTLLVLDIQKVEKILAKETLEDLWFVEKMVKLSWLVLSALELDVLHPTTLVFMLESLQYWTGSIATWVVQLHLLLPPAHHHQVQQQLLLH